MDLVVVITGGSSGIGKETANLFAEKGCVVYELSRTGKDQKNVRHITADVTDTDSVDFALNEIYKERGKIDLLINNAGMGISGAVEFTELLSAKRIFDVNFFGTFICTKAALPYLRKSNCPMIINLSSVAAPLAIPFQAFYSATKAAINSLTLAIKNELSPFGVRVTAIMPGDISTGFTQAREKNEQGEALYGKSIERAVLAMEKDELSGMNPKQIANLIYKISNKRRVKPLYTAGGKYKLFVALSKIMPISLSNYIVGKLYS